MAGKSRGKGNHGNTEADQANGRAAAPVASTAGTASNFRRGLVNMRKAGAEPNVKGSARSGKIATITGDVGSGFGPGFTKSG